MGDVFLGQVPVLENRDVGGATFLLRLEAPPAIRQGRPGQFVMLRTGPAPEKGAGPLLKRPFSIHRFGPGDEVALLYRVVGQGTDLMTRLRPGDSVEILGPLGRGFHYPVPGGPAYLVAGGLGLAPILALAEAWTSPASDLTLFYGALTWTEHLAAAHSGYGEYFKGQMVLSTEDGIGGGEQGLITTFLARALGERPAPVLACGPMPMLAEVARLAREAGVPCQVGLEAHMACGLGACLGCVVELNRQDARPAYARVCAEGPVFDAEEIRW